MFRTRIIYRFIGVLIIFALLIVVPFSFSIISQTQKMIEKEESLAQIKSPEYHRIHEEFAARLIEQMLSYIFYILVLAFILSFFFLRTMLISIRSLREGSQAMRDGRLDVRLDVLSDDELGQVTRAFNAMAEALNAKTEELVKKDLYISAMLDPLWVVDEDDRIVDINDAFTLLFGHTREDALGVPVYNFLDEKDAVIVRRQSKERQTTGRSSIYEIGIIAKTGERIPVLISGSPIFEGGRVVAKIGVLKDFREQNSMRGALQQSHDYIETVMNSIPDEIVVIDREYRIVMANRASLLRAGHDLSGEPCHSALHGRPKPCWTEGCDCPTQIVFATGKTHRAVHEHRDADGQLRFHEVIASPVADAEGNIRHVIELLSDITDRMKSEEQIMKKNKELTALNSISGILNRSLRPDEIFTKVLNRMIEMLGMDGGGIFFLDETTKEMTCRYHKGVSEDYVKMIGRIRLGEDIPGRVAVTGQIVTSSDISRDARIERSVMKHSGMRGYCCIPVRGKEKIIGVFCLFSFHAHLFTVEEENILAAIGDMTGMALENIRLYEKMRTLFELQKSRWTEEHQHLLQISDRLGSGGQLGESMTAVLGLLKQVFRADFVWLLSGDESGNLKQKFSSAATGKEGQVVYPADVSSLERYVLAGRQPVVVGDLRSEQKYYVAPEVSSYQTAAAVPMLMGDKPIGAFTLFYSMQKDFREDDLRFMEIIANMMAIAIERSEFHIRAGRVQELADTILQTVQEGIITVNTEGRIISVNRAFERLSGIKPERAFNAPVCEVFRFSEENIAFRLLLGEGVEEAKRGASTVRSGQMATLFGRSIPVTITSSPILDREGTVTGIVNLIRDVSREKELDRMKTELIRSVSHEFRTPLTAIVGLTEMLLQEEVEELRQEKYLGVIHDEGVRLSKMVSELLSIARIESGKETLQLSQLNLNVLLQEVAEAMGPLLLEKEAVLNIAVEETASLVADEEKMKQVLMNVIDNALTFSDKGCIINIEARRFGDVVEVSIADSGWGIAEEDLPHLRERFYRGRHGQKVKGTGLGLTLCHEILGMHGGSIDIASRLGDGTTVTMRIPFREVL